MGLTQKGYGIHGTNLPRSIGRAASHGCIRILYKKCQQLGIELSALRRSE
jgi:lipoprotein-anchoring transpeptidase ErfK/SrfK